MRTTHYQKFISVTARGTALAAMVLVTTTIAGTAVEISWEDLLPPSIDQIEQESGALRQQFQALSEEEKSVYRSVAEELEIIERIESEDILPENLGEERRAILDSKLSEKHPEVTAFWDTVKQLNDRMEAANASIDPELDGKSIRMPGYVLPVKIEDGKVFEFMLVPYVGACVHTPPPPPNQLVYVKSSEGFSSDSLYTPVWVEGVMATTAASYDLSYRDGDRDVEAGYLIDADAIEVYEEN